MKNRLILIIFIFFLTGCERKPLLDKLSGAKVTETITIDRWGEWVPTHIVLKSGQTFTVTATGKINVVFPAGYFADNWEYFYDPSGYQIRFYNGNYYDGQYYIGGEIIPGEISGKLYGKICDSAFGLGSYYESPAPVGGLLYLAINDFNQGTIQTGCYTIVVVAE